MENGFSSHSLLHNEYVMAWWFCFGGWQDEMSGRFLQFLIAIELNVFLWKKFSVGMIWKMLSTLIKVNLSFHQLLPLHTF